MNRFLKNFWIHQLWHHTKLSPVVQGI